jgi:hypothetical protein
MLLKKLGVLAAVITLLFTFIAAVPAEVGAQANKDAVCDGVGLVGGQGCDAPRGSPTIPSVMRTVVNILSWIIGIVAVIMLIIGGFKYVISGGDSASVKSAKDTILYALIGIAIAALAQVLVIFVLNQVAGGGGTQSRPGGQGQVSPL